MSPNKISYYRVYNIIFHLKHALIIVEEIIIGSQYEINYYSSRHDNIIPFKVQNNNRIKLPCRNTNNASIKIEILLFVIRSLRKQLCLPKVVKTHFSSNEPMYFKYFKNFTLLTTTRDASTQ